MPQKSPKILVLDSWALISFFNKEEPAASVVHSLLKKAENRTVSLHMHWINLGEVHYQSLRRVGLERGNKALEKVLLMPLQLHLPDTDDILAAAELKTFHRISYADAFAVALAQRLGAVVATGDPEIIALRESLGVLELTREKRNQKNAS